MIFLGLGVHLSFPFTFFVLTDSSDLLLAFLIFFLFFFCQLSYHIRLFQPVLELSVFSLRPFHGGKERCVLGFPKL